MFLRANKRFKDGKEHRYWSVVENRRVAGGRSVQKTLLSPGSEWKLHTSWFDRSAMADLLHDDFRLQPGRQQVAVWPMAVTRRSILFRQEQGR